jgi:hypothetical protein
MCSNRPLATLSCRPWRSPINSRAYSCGQRNRVGTAKGEDPGRTSRRHEPTTCLLSSPRKFSGLCRGQAFIFTTQRLGVLPEAIRTSQAFRVTVPSTGKDLKWWTLTSIIDQGAAFSIEEFLALCKPIERASGGTRTDCAIRHLSYTCHQYPPIAILQPRPEGISPVQQQRIAFSSFSFRGNGRECGVGIYACDRYPIFWRSGIARGRVVSRAAQVRRHNSGSGTASAR